MNTRKKTFIIVIALIFLGFYSLVSSITGSLIGYKIAKNPEIINNFVSSLKREDTRYVLTEKEIMKIIVDETPMLKNNNLSEYDIVSFLREWTFNNVPVVFNNPSLKIEEYKNVSSAVQIPFRERFSIFRNGEAAAWCSATASTLSDVYRLFGFESYTIDAGDKMEANPQATHSMTVVKINHKGKDIYSVQDAYFNYSLIDINNEPMDYFVLLNHLRNREDDLIIKKLGIDELKPRLLKSNNNLNTNVGKTFKNGNLLVKEKFELPNFEISAEEFLTKYNYPNNLLYLHMFPYNSNGIEYDKAQSILNKARTITGTWCNIDGECWGLSN